MPNGLKNKELKDPFNQTAIETILFKHALLFSSFFLFGLWAIRFSEWLLDEHFYYLGIYPRTVKGLVGIFTAPLIHADIYHLISNSFPVFTLGIGLFYFYRKIGLSVSLGIYLLSGGWTWLFGRSAYHMGASGLVYGWMFFLLISGFIKKDKRQLAITFVILILYGGSIFTGLFPGVEHISFEAHLGGAIAGTGLAFYYKKIQPFNAIKEQELEQAIIEEESDQHISHTADTTIQFNIKYRGEKDDL